MILPEERQTIEVHKIIVFFFDFSIFFQMFSFENKIEVLSLVNP